MDGCCGGRDWEIWAHPSGIWDFFLLWEFVYTWCHFWKSSINHRLWGEMRCGDWEHILSDGPSFSLYLFPLLFSLSTQSLTLSEREKDRKRQTYRQIRKVSLKQDEEVRRYNSCRTKVSYTIKQSVSGSTPHCSLSPLPHALPSHGYNNVRGLVGIGGWVGYPVFVFVSERSQHSLKVTCCARGRVSVSCSGSISQTPSLLCLEVDPAY